MDCREELQRVDAEMRALEGKLADQRATIERFRALVRELDDVFGPDSWLWYDGGDSRAAITAADMGEGK